MEQQQDLRKLFDEKRATESFQLKSGHKDRFLNRLDQELPKRSTSKWFVFKIAASVMVFIGLGFYWYSNLNIKNKSGYGNTVTYYYDSKRMEYRYEKYKIKKPKKSLVVVAMIRQVHMFV
mgnify:CR=1 FL=1